MHTTIRQTALDVLVDLGIGAYSQGQGRLSALTPPLNAVERFID